MPDRSLIRRQTFTSFRRILFGIMAAVFLTLAFPAGVFAAPAGPHASASSLRGGDQARQTDPHVMRSGVLVRSGKKIRYKRSNGKYFNGGWKKVKGRTYYFAKNTYALTGLRRVGKNYYIFSSKGVLKKGWVRRSGHYYYASPGSGALLTGWQTISGKRYYISVKTRYRLTGFQYIGGKVYYFNSQGVQQRKNQYRNGKKLRFNKDGSVRSYGGRRYGYSASRGQQGVNYARRFLGNPYKWGGSSLTHGADCSGFVMAVYVRFGISLPHYDASIRKCGRPVGSLASARLGDVICYNGHVAIYMGNNRIIHAANERQGICIGYNAAYTRILSIRRFF